MMSQNPILKEQKGKVLLLTFNRPEKKNALTQEMYEQMTQALNHAADAQDVHVVVMTGQGSDFSAGNDIAGFVAAVQDPERISIPLHFLQALSAFPKPLVAAVSGVAIGIGTSMLLHCDLVYADDTARFQLPFTRMGLVPEGGTSLLMPMHLGHRQAFELLVLGEAFSAEKAAQVGLINQVVPAASLLSLALEKAQTLSEMGPEAVRQSKAMMKEYVSTELAQVLTTEVKAFAARLSSSEAQAAFATFMSKKTAVA